MEIFRKDILIRYNQFSVDRNIKKEKLYELILNELSVHSCFNYKTDDGYVNIYYSYNKWESKYFELNSITLYFIDFYDEKFNLVRDALNSFLKELNNNYENSFILTIEIPSEDNRLIQVLNKVGFRIIETRLHYLNNDLEAFNYKRFDVRDASKN